MDNSSQKDVKSKDVLETPLQQGLMEGKYNTKSSVIHCCFNVWGQ